MALYVRAIAGLAITTEFVLNAAAGISLIALFSAKDAMI